MWICTIAKYTLVYLYYIYITLYIFHIYIIFYVIISKYESLYESKIYYTSDIYTSDTLERQKIWKCYIW